MKCLAKKFGARGAHIIVSRSLIGQEVHVLTDIQLEELSKKTAILQKPEMSYDKPQNAILQGSAILQDLSEEELVFVNNLKNMREGPNRSMCTFYAERQFGKERVNQILSSIKFS